MFIWEISLGATRQKNVSSFADCGGIVDVSVAEHLIATRGKQAYLGSSMITLETSPITLEASPSPAVSSLPVPPKNWRSLCDLSSAAEAAFLSARCRYSLETTEVLCSPPETNWALTEQKRSGVWRWAIYGSPHAPMAEGLSPTQTEAKLAASAAIQQGIE